MLEISQPAVLAVPENAVSTVAAQGQIGLGGTYYVSNGNNAEPTATFLKQGYARYHWEGSNLRIGRFEFVEGLETRPRNTTIAWVQTNRIANRLLGNFAFSNAQRSFDGELYAHVWGRTVISRIYPTGTDSNYGYAEFVYHWGIDQKGVQ